MSSNEVTLINSLIATTIDSANGYEEAAKNTHSADLGSQFAEFARDRQAVVTMLQAEVRRLGGTPETSGTTKAAAHRRWLDLKNAVAGSDAAILQEVENGETYIRTKYETALGDKALSTASRDVVSRAFDSVMTGHDRARSLNRSYGGTAPSQGGVWRTVGIAAALGGAAYAATRLMRSRRQTSGTMPRRQPTASVTAVRTTPAPMSSSTSTYGTSSTASTSGSSRGIDAASTRSGGRSRGTAGATSLAASGSDDSGSSFGSAGESSGSFGSTGSGTSFGAIGSDDLGRK